MKLASCWGWILVTLCCVLAGAGLANAAEPLDVVFQAAFDGTMQRYVKVEPFGWRGEEAVSVLIVLHGHGSDRWQFVKDARDECRAAREVASKNRMLLISPDYRAKNSWMGPAAEADLAQIIQELKRQYRVSKVIVSGGSMGGTSALSFAGMHPELVDGVVSLNGTANMLEYDQFQDAIVASYGGTKQDRQEEYRKRSAELQAGRLSMPIAMTTGGQDTLVPPDSCFRLAADLKKQKRDVLLIHRQEGGHSTNYVDSLAAFGFVIGRSANHISQGLPEKNPSD